MNYRLPNDCKKEEDAYQQIEPHSRRGGQYPVGKNNCWHSGVHCFNLDQKPVYPIINGAVVACRYSDSISAIPRLYKITKDEWGKLSELERELYHIENDQDHRNNIYTLKYEHLDKDAYNKLCDEYKIKNKEIDSWFELKETGYEPIEKVSTEYIILKHEIGFPEHKEKNKKIVFFTLYMGLTIFISEFKDYYNNFKSITGGIKGRNLPAFQK